MYSYLRHLRGLGRTKNAHQRATEIWSVLRALPDGLPKNEMELSREVNGVPKNARVGVVAHGDRRISLEAVLAR